MAKKIVLASGKGGVGKSTLTAGIAIALCKLGVSTLVIDFDIGMGCLDLILASDDTGIFNWGDVLRGECEPQTALRSTVGPKLLVAPTEFDDAFTAENVRKMIDKYDEDFEYILLDAPAGVDGGFSLAAACADSGIIVTTPDEVCVRVGLYAADILKAMGLDDTRLVVNRFNKSLTARNHYLNIDDVIDSTLLQLLGVVPEDRKLNYCSVTGMQSLDKSPAQSAFGRIARRLLGVHVNLKI